MIAPTYQVLLQEYREVLLTKNTTAARSDSFSIEGIDFTFYHEPEADPDRLYIRCEVFDLENKDNAQLVSHLLTDNFLRYRQRKPVFAMCPDMIRVIALINLSITETNTQKLHETVLDLVKEIKQWRSLSWLKEQKIPASSLTGNSFLWKAGHVKR